MTAASDLFYRGVDLTLDCHKPGPMMDAAVRLAETFFEQGVPFRFVDLGRLGRPSRLPLRWAARVDFNPTKHSNIVLVEFGELEHYASYAKHAFIDRRPWGVLLAAHAISDEDISRQIKPVEGVITDSDASAARLKAAHPRLKIVVLPLQSSKPPRIAILHRGPIRPSASSVAARMPRLVGQFRDTGAICESYLATWRHTDPVDLDAVWLFADHVLTYEQPSDEFVAKHLNRRQYPLGLQHDCINAFYQYYMCKRAIGAIEAAGPYDFIVHSRTDLDVHLGKHLNEWLVKGDYNTWHLMGQNGLHIADQFSVADPATMRLAWDYGTETNLGRMLDEVYMPEFVLQRTIDAAGIKAARRDFESISIDRG